jgi:Family of unknown function (DUF6130)
MRARLTDHLVSMGQLAIAAVAGGVLIAADAVAQSAREVRDATPYLAIENEPPPKLIVDPPLAAASDPGHRLDSVSGGERAYRASVRHRRAQRISTGRASAHTLRRPALVVGGPEWYQYNRLGRSTARLASCASTWSTRTIRPSPAARCAARR